MYQALEDVPPAAAPRRIGRPPPPRRKLRRTTVGAVIERLYDRLVQVYGDPELAAVATSALLTEALFPPVETESASSAA